MKWLSALAILVALSGCAKNMTQSGDILSARSACARGAPHAEVSLSGTVSKLLGIRSGPSGLHEGFVVSIPPATYRVEDNIDITGRIPLRRGDRIELMGQFECNDGVIHWTHHDPSGRHIAGYIKVNGYTYQ